MDKDFYSGVNCCRLVCAGALVVLLSAVGIVNVFISWAEKLLKFLWRQARYLLSDDFLDLAKRLSR